MSLLVQQEEADRRRYSYAFENSENRRGFLRQTASLESKLNDKQVQEIEDKIRNLRSAFFRRTKKIKEKIVNPPTPESELSEIEENSQAETNFLDKLRQIATFPSQSDFDSKGEIGIGWQKQLAKLKKILNCNFVIDPQSSINISWLFIISFAFIYNAWTIPLRFAFEYGNDNTLIIIDYIADAIYLMDIFIKSQRGFIKNGFWVLSPALTRKNYFHSRELKIDILSVFPLDHLIYFVLYFGVGDEANYPLIRLNRFLKLGAFKVLFSRLDIILSSSYVARISQTILYMIYIIHLNGCLYYFLSRVEGIGSTSWTYNGEGNAYIRCFYFATKTSTSIGKNPKPENENEYLFMTFLWLQGVFAFAFLIGQIRDIIATASKTQTEYRMLFFETINYMNKWDIPAEMQERVKLWLSYTWKHQKTFDETKIMSLLPIKMQTDIALNVHVETLSKVKLFQDCEVSFLRDLVLKLRSSIFLPGDYICKRGEVGKEMYIVKTGKISVLGGENEEKILIDLSEGSVFGEIALLGLKGINRRSASVRSVGFSNLFVLSKEDLNEAIRDYPAAQEILRKKAKRVIKEKEQKEKEEKKKQEMIAARLREANSSESPYPSEKDEVIIKNPEEKPMSFPKLLQFIIAAKLVQFGSKAATEEGPNSGEDQSIIEEE